MAVDPVCKMNVNEKTAKFKSEYKGKTYYFCALACKKSFDESLKNIWVRRLKFHLLQSR